MISNKLNQRSQHSLKNRFFHLMSTNLNITNKACLKRKNFADDIIKIIDKYRKLLKEPNENEQASTEQNKKEECPKAHNSKAEGEEEKEKIKKQQIEVVAPHVKIEHFEFQKQVPKLNLLENSMPKIQEIFAKNNIMNPFFQNYFNNGSNLGFYPQMLNRGLMGFNPMNAFFDTRMMFNPYQNFFLNKFS